MSPRLICSARPKKGLWVDCGGNNVLGSSEQQRHGWIAVENGEKMNKTSTNAQTRP